MFMMLFPCDFIFYTVERLGSNVGSRAVHGLTSTCSEDQLSILRDLTLEIWVPILRCRAAQRIQRKMPNYIPLSVSLMCVDRFTGTYVPTGPS